MILSRLKIILAHLSRRRHRCANRMGVEPTHVRPSVRPFILSDMIISATSVSVAIKIYH